MKNPMGVPVVAPSKMPESRPDGVGFLPGVPVRPPPGRRRVELALDQGRIKRDARRAAVDHAAQARSVGFAKGGQTENPPEGGRSSCRLRR